MSAIETSLLTKSFDGKTDALHQLNLNIPEGAVFGFLGPNGAGKTTAIRLINGILNPTEGFIKVFGMEPSMDAAKIHAVCGVMTENAAVYESMTGTDNLIFFGRLFGLTHGESKIRSAELMRIFNLEDAAGRKAKTYSTGMKKKLSLARALIHKPRALFLDEPTSGLDPEAAKSVNDFIKETAQREKVTVFLCTHQLRYAEDICTHYGFLDKGNLLGFGTLPELMRQKKESVKLILRGTGIPSLDGLTKDAENTFSVPVSNDEEAAGWISKMSLGGARLFEAWQKKYSLEDLYFAFRSDAGGKK